MQSHLAESTRFVRPSRGRSAILAALVVAAAAAPLAAQQPLERVRVADDQRSFVMAASGKTFTPWGFNYDHDASGRLIEDYWNDEWPTVEADFAEMRALGANIVRVHLQFGRFMNAPAEPNAAALAQFARLVELAEGSGVYLDITGLGCYHKQDVPAWYDKLNESERWAAQACFWEAVAGVGAGHPAVFCYDLMNEPVVAAGKPREDWLGGAFGDKHFVQFINLDTADRDRVEVARAWIETLVAAIRRRDPAALVTVGLVPWSLERPGLQSGFVPARIVDKLDFIAVHLYPERDQLEADLETLRGFNVGKPVVIEETFSLRCGGEEHARFVAASRELACGWIGFYWGVTPEEYREETTIPAALMVDWLERFRAGPPGPPPGP